MQHRCSHIALVQGESAGERGCILERLRGAPLGGMFNPAPHVPPSFQFFLPGAMLFLGTN